MKRRAFIQQCGTLPALTVTGGSCVANTQDQSPPLQGYCFDGFYAELELVLGHDLSWCLSESTQLFDSFKLNIKNARDLFRDCVREMPDLSIRHPGDLPRRSLSSREYLIVILGVEIRSGIVSSDFPIAGKHHPDAARRQLHQLQREILQINQSHQDVWFALHPPSIPEYDPITGARIYRN